MSSGETGGSQSNEKEISSAIQQFSNWYWRWCWSGPDVNSFCPRLFMAAISIFHHGWVTAIEKVFSSPRRNVSIFFRNILRSVTKSNVLFAVDASTASNIVSLRLIQSTWFHFKNISVWDSFEMFLKSFCPLSRIWIFVSGSVCGDDGGPFVEAKSLISAG